jgi:hypothetical protein
MAIIPVMEVDLYELSNNHIWRAGFAFRDFGEAPAEYMKIERNEHGLTEWGWINFGFENYYALLNCGFRLRPTAGTANGVHPVPLGFGRVYVKIDGEFSIASWLQALNKGRSFVTTGPMLFTDIKGERSGEVAVDATVLSESPSVRVELIVNGQVHETFHPETTKSGGPHEFRVRNKLLLTTTSWVAVRAFESRPGNRVRFAHSSPVFIDMPGKPLRPRKAEVDYLVDRVRQEIGRSRSLLPPQALAEYQKALELYRNAASAAN